MTSDFNRARSFTLLGSSGGLAKAVLSLLNAAVTDNNDPIHGILVQTELHLIDLNQREPLYYSDLYPNLFSRLHLHQMDLNNLQAFKQHLVDTDSRLVIDVSWADTLEMLNCCNELAIPYVNSALENKAVDEDPTLYGFPLTERYDRFEDQKAHFTNTHAIVCSGMNPGVVQWMAFQLQQENPDRTPLACYVVEHDSSFFTDALYVQPQTLYTSWSVECFLDEAILSYPMFVKGHVPHYLHEEVYSAEYKVRLGEKQFYGCLMPHEEVLTLGMLRDWEVGFIYRVNDLTTGLIRNHLDHVDELWDWNQQILEPSLGDVSGEDLVGVLFVYDNEEKYLYNVMNSRDIYPIYRTNATYLQVACGVYAAIACILLDPVPRGVHYIDELLQIGGSRYGDYLSTHMKTFVRGTNDRSDGFLLQRRREA
ncbi:S-adenosylmethionine decarboxylase related protein [Cohnella sp.]|uniref:S-adenosylmethionine decarboxylase related protein n=1 Tax=Cohnella sp. TaxID=1883426 RepID=UPI0035632C1E